MYTLSFWVISPRTEDTEIIVNCVTVSAISSLKECNATPSPMSTKSFIGSTDASVLSRSVEQLNSPLDQSEISSIRRSKHTSSSISRNSSRSGTWGSISRVFARSKNRSKSSILQGYSHLIEEEKDCHLPQRLSGEMHYDSYRNWSPLTEEGYAEKLRLLREASSIPMERWKASTVLAWLEVGLGMPQYGARCAENIKSGKVAIYKYVINIMVYVQGRKVAKSDKSLFVHVTYLHITQQQFFNFILLTLRVKWFKYR